MSTIIFIIWAYLITENRNKVKNPLRKIATDFQGVRKALFQMRCGRGVQRKLCGFPKFPRDGERLTAPTGWAMRSGRAHRKAKKFGQGRPNTRGVAQKISLSDRGGRRRFYGVTQILSISNTPRYYTYRYKLLTELSTFRFTFAAWVSKSLYYFPPPLLLASSTLSQTILASTRSLMST